MSKVYMFFATGYEEVEALTVVDLLRREGIEVEMVSVTGDYDVTSSHNVTVRMDKLFSEIDDSADMLVLPGGMPGTLNLKAHEGLKQMILRYNENPCKYLAAICAAPTVYGEMGLLKNKKACCYPGMESGLLEANVSYDPVSCDGTFVTSRGLGTAIAFGLELVTILKNKDAADALAEKIVYKEK